MAAALICRRPPFQRRADVAAFLGRVVLVSYSYTRNADEARDAVGTLISVAELRTGGTSGAGDVAVLRMPFGAGDLAISLATVLTVEAL